jgi:hypothetical protein
MRSKAMRLLIILCLLGSLLLLPLSLFSGTALAFDNWLPKATGGFGDPTNLANFAMAVYNSQLYVGTETNPGFGGLGCEVWRYDGVTWAQMVGQSAAGTPGTGPGFGNANNFGVYRMAVLGSYLYAGTENPNGCEIWRYDGANWTQVVGQGTAGTATGPGFGKIANVGVHSMASDANYLYAGTNNIGDGCEVWRFDGDNWTQLAGQSPPGTPGTGPGFGDDGNACAHSMTQLGSYLYAGTYNNLGCEVWRFDGTNWTQLVGQGAAGTSTGPGFGDPFNFTAWSAAAFDTSIYIGTERANLTAVEARSAGASHTSQSPLVNQQGIAQLPGEGCQVWRLDGSEWSEVVGQSPDGTPGTGPGFGDPNNVIAYSLTVSNNFLYAGTANGVDGCQVWSFDRNSWTQSSPNAFGGTNIVAACGAQAFGTLFIGTVNFGAVNPTTLNPGTPNPAGSEVWALPYKFYFAEGYTGSNFREYLCLGNPYSATAHVNINYLFPDGTSQNQAVEVQANSHTTVFVNPVVGQDKEVSCQLEADLPIVAERPMYFNYDGDWTGGDDAIGATGTSTIWYFAEGYTGPGFEEWICVLNPQGQAADLTFNFQTQEDGVKVVTGQSVPAHSRKSFKVNDLLGNNYQTALRLDSNIPVVAERPMYFNYQGTSAWNWTGGHCVMGASSLAYQYSFAEGTTRPGFEEWLTLQNPNTEAVTINAVYRFGSGQGDPMNASYTVEAGKRSTIYVPQAVGPDKDVSVSLSCASPFLAERPMYFRYTGFGADWTGGHCVIGATETATNWFFAEGYTGENFQEWLCMENPGDSKAVVELDYYTQERGALDPWSIEVPARTRVTVSVNSSAGPDLQLSTRARVISGPAIVAERPMYFNYGGVWSGGHDAVGYVP